MHHLLAASLLGGALSFEYRSSSRLHLSAPLVSGPLTGWFLGEPALGLLAGLTLQLLFIGTVRLRGRPEPDLPPAGVISAAAFVLVSRDTGSISPPNGLILFWSLLLGLTGAAIGSIFYSQWERFAARPAAYGLELARRGRTRTASAVHMALSLVHFAWGSLLVFVLLPTGMAAVRFLSTRIEVISAGSMGSLVLVISLVAAGALIKVKTDRTRIFWFGAGFLIAAVFFAFAGGL